MFNKKQAKQKKKQDKVMEKPLEIVSMMNSETDPNGSYTGVPVTEGEHPTQDADDL